MKFHPLSLFILSALCCFNNAVLGIEEPLMQISKGSIKFAAELIKHLHHGAGQDENIFVSPFNIYTAMSMVLYGAGGTTRAELADVLGLPKDDQEIVNVFESFNKLMRQWQRPDNNVEVRMGNGLFVQKDFSVKQSFNDILKKYFFNEAFNLDISGDAKASTDFINKFISDNTKGRIPKLFETPIDPATVIVLATSLYFHGRWHKAFPEHLTKVAKFHTGVKEIDVHMMNHVKNVPYYNDASKQFESIILPYDSNGDSFSMAIILPYKSQTLMNLTNYLRDEDFVKLFATTTYEGVDYKIPRIKLTFSKSLVDTLSMAGIKELFQKADLSNMVDNNNLRVSDVTHGAEIEVDEKGTKASAVTAIQFMTYSLDVPPLESKKFVVERPFMLLVFNHETSIPLFTGLIHKPSGENL